MCNRMVLVGCNEYIYIVFQGLLCSMTIPSVGVELKTLSSTSLVVLLPLRPASVSAVSVGAATLGLVVPSMELGAMVCQCTS